MRYLEDLRSKGINSEFLQVFQETTGPPQRDAGGLDCSVLKIELRLPWSWRLLRMIFQGLSLL